MKRVPIRSWIVSAALVLSVQVAGQVDCVAMRYGAAITQDMLRTHLGVLASDAFEGRETGRKGEKMAAAYIMDQFRKDGIPPVPGGLERGLMADGYRQQFPVVISKPGGISLNVAGKDAVFMKDYFTFDEQLAGDLQTGEVMVLNTLTLGGAKLGGGSKVVLLLDDDKSGNGLMPDLRKVSETLVKTGTQVVLVATPGAKAIMEGFGGAISEGRMRLDVPERKNQSGGVQVMVVTMDLAESLLHAGGLNVKKAMKKATRKRLVVKVPVRFTSKPLDEHLTAENVLGYVEGSDRKGELVVVTAHYDHVGMKDGEVYNGADDDGSGTVAVLAMAHAFAKAKAEGHGPRRSVLFMTVSGEEKGLLGSRWYTDHPVFPLDSTVVDLNIDMIGRVDTVHGDSSRFVYVIGSKRLSSELGAIVEEQNHLYTKLDLDYTFDADGDPNRFYYRSDHYNFAKKGIPVAFFFNGVHADYHGPHDEVDRIRFDLLQQRTLLVFHTAWELANRDRRPVVDGAN